MRVSFKDCFKSESKVSVNGTVLNILNFELGLVLCLFPFFLPLFHSAMEKRKSRFSV